MPDTAIPPRDARERKDEMKTETTNRGFDLLSHPVYPPSNPRNASDRLVQASSVVGEYDDALERPGSSALWIGDNHHLCREEVAELVGHLTRWLDTGRLAAPE